MILGVAFAALLVVSFGYGVYEARDYPLLARIFPYWISLVAFCLALAQLVIEIRKYVLHIEEIHADFVDLAPDRSLPPRVVYIRGLRYVGWMVGLYAGIWLVGFVIAMTGFLLAFLRWEARLGWAITSVLAISGALFVIGTSWILTLFWPEGLISQWLGLPWPLT
jgi:hypothetical protein